MPVATTYLKLLLTLAAVLFFYYKGPVDWLLLRAAPASATVALVLVGLSRALPRFRGWLPNPSYFWLAPLFALALWGRLGLEPAVPDPPDLWYSLSRAKPVYDDSLMASGVVRRWIGPRTYLVDVSLRATQKKIKVYYPRRYKNKKNYERHSYKTRYKKKRYDRKRYDRKRYREKRYREKRYKKKKYDKTRRYGRKARL